MTSEALIAVDEWLVLRAQLGDRASVERLLEWCRPRLRAYLARAGGPLIDADDLAQDVLVIVWRKLYQLSEPRAFWVWTLRVASRELARAVRRRRRGPSLERWGSADEAPNPDEPLPRLDAEDRLRLFAQLDALTPNSREVIALHYGEGLSIGAVAAVLRVPEGTVKSRLHGALGALRRGLEGWST